MLNIPKLYEAAFTRVRSHLSHRQYLILSSIVVGLTAGSAAVLLKTVVHYIQSLLTNDFRFRYHDYLYLIFPMIGIVLTVAFIKYFLKGKFGKGAGHILHHISRKLSLVDRATMYSHMVTSALTVGFGGSAGLEAPIVVTGAAIGSNYGRVNGADYRDRTLLLACGSAAGIAAVFDAPIAGVMFALEVLISEASITAFIPLIVASASGALVSKVILQEKILLYFSLRTPFDYHNVPYYLLLGIMAGLMSVYYARTFKYIEGKFHVLKERNFSKAVTGGLLLAVLVFLFPPLFGEGYESIKFLASGETEKLLENSIFSFLSANKWFVAVFIGVVAVIKVFATSFTLGSGGNGGNFAPSLFVGAFLGFFYSRMMNLLTPGLLPEANFTLVGMAGILSGIMYAPLTGIFLIAELTGGYDLMIPLMIVSASSYAIVRRFEPYSMDAVELARRGELIAGNKDKAILTLMNVEELIEKDFTVVKSDMPITSLPEIIAHSKRNAFPVVSSDNHLIGIIRMENIREMLFELQQFRELPVVDLMDQCPAMVEQDEEMSSVMKKFDETGAWNLPVVKDKEYIGFISKSSLFTKYRTELLSQYLEDD